MKPIPMNSKLVVSIWPILAIIASVGGLVTGSMPQTYAITVIMLSGITLFFLLILCTYHVHEVDVTVSYDRATSRDPLIRPQAGDLFIRYKAEFGFTHFRCTGPASSDDGRIQGQVRELEQLVGFCRESTVVLWPHEWQQWAKQAECVFIANRGLEAASLPVVED